MIIFRRGCINKLCFTYCLCYVSLCFIVTPVLTRLSDNPDNSRKPKSRNEIVEGSGLLGNNAKGDEEKWHASGLNPDDEPGDDADDDEERHEGSGDMVEGSGASVQRSQPKAEISPVIPTTQHSSTTQMTRQTDRQFDILSHTSTREPPLLVSVASSTAAVSPDVQSTTSTITQATTTTATRKPAVMINTRPTPQPETPFISEIEQPFEMLRPGILAAVSGGAVVGVLMTILLIMFIVYRMRKKDEGSYSLDEPHQPPNYSYAYQKASTKEFYA